MQLTLSRGLGFKSRPSRVRMRNCVVNFASNHSKSRYEGYGGGSSTYSYERVLRYPDGSERRIVYPLAEQKTAAFDDDLTDADDAIWETRNAFKGVQTRPPGLFADIDTAAPTAPKEDDKNKQNNRIPDSPLELLRHLTSEKRRQEDQAEMQAIKDSYSIIDEVPWPLPKPLYVLAYAQEDTDIGMTYTLRTRLPLDDVQGELKEVLGRSSRDDGDFISCSRLVDGVVAFEDDGDAETYGELLEMSNGRQLSVARCDSHELFRDVQSIDTVVVLLRRGCTVPQPHQLAASVRNNTESLWNNWKE